MSVRRCVVGSARIGCTIRSAHARCLSTAQSQARRPLSMQKRKVVVIGAGFAGISAARTLLREGHGLVDVTVLEAGSRVGGRACTLQLPNCGPVEYGATWFHGIHGNPLYEHAVRLGLINRKEAEGEQPTWGAIKYVREGQKQLLNEEDAAMMTKARDEYGQAVESSLAGAHTGAPAVVGQGIRHAFQQAMEQLGDASERSRALFTDGWAWREQLQRAMDGCYTTDDVSAISLAQYEEFDGPNIPLPSGYQTLAEKLAEGLPIQHGVTVSNVAWGKDGVRLQCADGQSIEADAVIVTVSLGVLKAQHGTMFQPALPDSTVSAINNLGFGIVDKIFVDFGSAVESASASPHDFSHQGLAGGSNGDQSKAIPQSSTGHTDSHSRNAEQAEPLGQKEVVSYSLLWKRDQQEFAPKQVQQSDAAHHKQSAGQATGNSQAGQGQDQTGSKGAGDKTPESHVVVSTTDSSLPSSSSLRDDHTAAKLPSWAHGVYTLRFAGSEFVHGKQSNAVAASNRCGVMWITGDFAQSMESTSDPELQTGIAAILQRFPALQLPCTFRAYRSSWGSDPLFRGSYSYGSATATGQECQVLSKPVCPLGTSMPTLLLAGEACHPQYFGCTHGAYLTGQSQAQVLLKSYFPISVHGAAS